MAELVGVVASGISIAALAVQIAQSVAKLKSYWDEVKEAPEEIRNLVEEIEDLQSLFLDIEQDQRRNPISSMIYDPTTLSRCLENCRRGANRLKELTDDLGMEVDATKKLTRRWTGAKLFLKKDKIEKYKARLESAIRLLSLSYQCYTSLRTYNIVPGQTLALAIVRAGHDLKGLQQLFDSGKASVYDIHYLDWGDRLSLLQAATTYGNLSMIRFLLERGAEANLGWRRMDAPVNRLVSNGFFKEGASTDSIEAARLLVDTYEAELELSTLGAFRGTREAFQVLQKLTDVPYYQSSLERRINIAINLARWAPDNGPELLSIAIEPGFIPRTAIRYASAEIGTLLHAVAYAVGRAMGTEGVRNGIVPMEDLPGWRQLIRELVSQGANLHSLRRGSRRQWGQECQEALWTPIYDLFAGLISVHIQHWCVGAHLSELSHSLLKTWLEDLEASGVDLLEYGKKERAMHDHLPISQNCRDINGEAYSKLYLVEFTYGASPDDWHLSFLDPADFYAGQFCEMVDRPEVIMPGSWVD
ncbi:hypothetical protein MMC13_004598 [Lambiella insularis]|nr:hypothetical protein [Lambiella insularis]